jgi:hypothetical protein
MLNKIFPKRISSAHVDLLIPIGEGLRILESVGNEIIEEHEGGEHTFYVDAKTYEIRIFEKKGLVVAVWYNDPLGRSWAGGITRKVNLYLERYGPLVNWEIRMNNGWMKYYFNDVDQVGMVYGIHNDVIRINSLKDIAD